MIDYKNYLLNIHKTQTTPIRLLLINWETTLGNGTHGSSLTRLISCLIVANWPRRPVVRDPQLFKSKCFFD